VGSDGVVLDPLVLDQHAGLEQAAERLDGEQLVAQPPAEALHVRVLPRRARLDVAGPGAVAAAPVTQGVAVSSGPLSQRMNRGAGVSRASLLRLA
jgi:hypothetical protein